MKHWLQPKPLRVLACMLALPIIAMVHLLATWAPKTLEARRMMHDLNDHAHVLEPQVARLEQARVTTAEIEARVGEERLAEQTVCLPGRDRNGVSDALAATLRQHGVAMEALVFEESGLYAATDSGDVLACERVRASCRGTYAGLTQCLDALPDSGLPVRLTWASWSRDDPEVMLELALEIPFRPDEALAARLRAEAGLEVDDEL